MAKRSRQLLCPLLAQAGRREDQHAVDRAARAQLGDDQAGLNRLAQPDVVGQQQPRPRRRGGRPARARAGAASARCRARCAARSEPGGCVGGDERAAGATPAHAVARSGRAADVRGDGGVSNGVSTRRSRPPKRLAEPAQRDDLAIVVCAHVDDPPARAADDDEIAGADVTSVRETSEVEKSASRSGRSRAESATRVLRAAGNQRVTAGERA